LILPVIYALYWALPGKKRSQFSFPIGEASAGEGVPRRNTLTKELVKQPAGCATLYESFARAAKEYNDRDCLGVRKTIREIKKEVTGPDGNKRTWVSYERGPFNFKTFTECFQASRTFASGLRSLGLNPKEKLAIYEETCYEWVTAEQACYTQSFIVLTVYANLGLEALAYALDSAKVEFIMANGKLLSQLVSIKDKIHLKYVISAVGGFGTCFGVQDGDSYLSYLPLAHVLAMVVSNAVIHYGGITGFGNTKTLTDDSMVDGCLGDIREFRPTAFAGVPLVYDRIKAGILKKVEAESKVKQAIFRFALVIKQYAWKNNKSTPLLDAIVFNQFKSRLGGRVRFMVSGGAPLSSSAHLFLASCFGVPLLQGYGLTETCGAGTVMQLDDHSQGTVGPPVPCVEIKLVDVEDMGYTTKNNPPQGEIWMRGPSITKGYYNAPEKTEEVYTPDGWFKTGDIGMWNKNGTLSIVDRVKNLVKGPYGEYIALEKLESVYKNSSYVLNACIYASKETPHIIAIVEPQPPVLEARGITNVSTNKEFAAEVKKDLNTTGTQNGLKKFELVTHVILVGEEWNPNNNMLTAAMKLNRRSIYQTYQKRIDEALKQ